ncbi:MAG: hypothetical protein Q7S23_03930 [bacterium]|nr:hypothetical protein [bacterium]
MVSSHLATILEELYALEPSLRQHETRLREIIAALISAQPQVTVDEAFVRRLRAELLQRLDGHPQEIRQSFFTLSFMQKFMYAAGGVALATLLIVPTMTFLRQRGAPAGETGTWSQTAVTARGGNAFGTLSSLAGNMMVARDSSKMAVGLGGGGGVATAERATLSAPSMVAPDMIVGYRFVFRGEPIELKDDQRTVYRRIKGNLPAASSLLGLGSGLLDLGSFGGAKLQSVNLTQETDDGYQVFVDLQEGMVSINQRYPYPGPMPEIAGNPLQPSDLPPDAEVIALATDFLRQHGVPLSGYGEPAIQEEQRLYLMAQEKSVPAYVPEYLNVVFPQLVDGLVVHDEGGNVHGVNVSINVRTRQVGNVWNLTTQQFESSQYAAETDFGRIVKVVQARSFTPEGSQSKVYDVVLGTPSLAYVKVWRYENNRNDELLVPAASFPVLESSKEQPYWSKAIVVPLIKELLEPNPDLPSRGGGVMPLPADALKAVPGIEAVPPTR